MSELTVEEQIAAKFAGNAPEPAPAEEQVDTAGETTPDEQAAPEPEQEETPALLAGKYKTADELEKAHLELQSLLGRQGNELAEARALREQFDALRADLKPADRPTYDPGSLDEQFASNPTIIPAYAQKALDAGDDLLYGKAITAWQEHDPFGAAAFHANALAEQKINELRQEFAPTLKQAQQTASTSEFQSAFEARAALHEDFAAVLDSITPEIMNGFPKEVLGVLQSGDQASKEQVLETLYRWTKAEQAGTLTQAAANAASQVAQDALTARQEAAVASTTGSQDRQPVAPVTFNEHFQNSDAFKKAAGLK